MDVEAFDLVGDNTGPLAELCNLDKGLLVNTSVCYARYL